MYVSVCLSCDANVGPHFNDANVGPHFNDVNEIKSGPATAAERSCDRCI